MEKLGDLINREFRKSGLTPQEFADKIYTTRENVYKIFKKENLDVRLLGRISETLNHDFFADVAGNLDLVVPEDQSIKELEREKAKMQFWDVFPSAMKELKRQAFLQMEIGFIEDSVLPPPDLFMVPYAITFTYGEPYRNYPQIKKTMEECPQFLRVIDDGKGHSVEIIHTLVADSQCCNVVIDYKTKEEWKEMMKFVFDVINQYYTPGNKFNLQRTFGYRIKW